MRVDWCVSSWFRIKNTHCHFENPQRPTLLVTLSISRLSNTKCCDRGWPIFFLFFLGVLWAPYHRASHETKTLVIML